MYTQHIQLDNSHVQTAEISKSVSTNTVVFSLVLFCFSGIVIVPSVEELGLS